MHGFDKLCQIKANFEQKKLDRKVSFILKGLENDFTKIITIIEKKKIVDSHRGNYGYLLSHFLGKNFVKVTVLLKKLLNS